MVTNLANTTAPKMKIDDMTNDGIIIMKLAKNILGMVSSVMPTDKRK